jgi:hypothetical protein
MKIHKDKRVPDNPEYQEYYDRCINRRIWYKFVKLPPGNDWPSGSWVVAGENHFLLTLFQRLDGSAWVVYAQGIDDCTREREFATLAEAEEQFDKIVDGMNQDSLSNLFQFEAF